MRILVLLILFLIPISAVSKEAVPDVSVAAFQHEEKGYVAGRSGRAEVAIRTYKNPDGSVFKAYSIGGAIFRYDVNIGNFPSREYRLVDRTGSGEWVKEDAAGEIKVREPGGAYMMEVGPETKEEPKYGYEKSMYRYMLVHRPDVREQRETLMGFPVFVPQWVIIRFDLP